MWNRRHPLNVSKEFSVAYRAQYINRFPCLLFPFLPLFVSRHGILAVPRIHPFTESESNDKLLPYCVELGDELWIFGHGDWPLFVSLKCQWREKRASIYLPTSSIRLHESMSSMHIVTKPTHQRMLHNNFDWPSNWSSLQTKWHLFETEPSELRRLVCVYRIQDVCGTVGVGGWKFGLIFPFIDERKYV